MELSELELQFTSLEVMQAWEINDKIQLIVFNYPLEVFVEGGQFILDEQLVLASYKAIKAIDNDKDLILEWLSKQKEGPSFLYELFSREIGNKYFNED